VDYTALKVAVDAWLAALADSDPGLAWAKDVSTDAHPAYLLPQTGDDGERERAQATAALPIKVKEPPAPDRAAVQKLHDWVVRDRTLGGRVARATFEWPGNDEGTISILVVEPQKA
jgi:hypothetical protein